MYLFVAALGLCSCTGLALVAVEGGHSSCGAWASHCGGFSCRTWALGLVAPLHVGSSRTEDRTCVPCTGRWILHHWTMKEVLNMFLKCQETSTIPSTCKLHAQSPSPTFQHHPPQKFSSERWSLIKIGTRRVLSLYFSTDFLNRQYLGFSFLYLF